MLQCSPGNMETGKGPKVPKLGKSAVPKEIIENYHQHQNFCNTKKILARNEFRKSYKN